MSKSDKKPEKPVIVVPPANQAAKACIECGEPLAPGQNYVCKDHIKAV